MVEAIACVYKTGGDYTAEYVRRLYQGVKKYSSRPLVCLSDDPEAEPYCDEYRPLQEDLPGWWSKIEAFSLQSALYLDLDTIIQRNIDPICDHPHGFTMLSDLNPKNDRPTSGVMAWNGDYSYMLEGFDKRMIGKYRVIGDQGYIADSLSHKPDRMQKLFPGQVCSYKWGRDFERRRAAIICYHGKPRPHETGWKT